MKNHLLTQPCRCTSLHVRDKVIRLNSETGPIVLHSHLVILVDDNYIAGFLNTGHVYATAYRFFYYDDQIRCAIHAKDLY